MAEQQTRAHGSLPKVSEWHDLASWSARPRRAIEFFREIFNDRICETLDAPRNAYVLDIGANIGALTLWWGVG